MVQFVFVNRFISMLKFVEEWIGIEKAPTHEPFIARLHINGTDFWMVLTRCKQVVNKLVELGHRQDTKIQLKSN